MTAFFVPVPFFDKYLTVEAYLLRYNYMNSDPPQTTGEPRKPPLLQELEFGAVEAYGGGRLLFVPVRPNLLDWHPQVLDMPGDKTVFLLEEWNGELSEARRASMKDFLEAGYRFAVTQTTHYIDDNKLLEMTDFLVFGTEAMVTPDRRAHILRYKNVNKNLQIAATGLDSKDAFRRAQKDGFHLYEGMFYRVPVSRSDRELTPIKANLIRLLNLVRDEDFEFHDVAAIVRQDPALTYSLMRFINSPYIGIRFKVKSIQQAVAILGQIEVRKWVSAAVFRALGADRPGELTRIALVRAKYAENLSAYFHMEAEAPSLFLMGLFSVLDIMLETDMENALSQVLVTDVISDALIRHAGPYEKIRSFIVNYESADWALVRKHCREQDLDPNNVIGAYRDAVCWHYELVNDMGQMRRMPLGAYKRRD